MAIMGNRKYRFMLRDGSAAKCREKRRRDELRTPPSHISRGLESEFEKVELSMAWLGIRSRSIQEFRSAS